MQHIRTILLLCVLAGMLGGILGMGAAEEQALREYQVKAAMICNFAQFVEWPADAFDAADSPLVIVVAGANPFGTVLEQIVEGKTVGRRAIEVRYARSVEQVGRCHVLFTSRSASSSELQRLMQKIAGQPVLSVGETDAFPRAGGVIRFYSEDSKVRFEISPAAADEARLKISSKLMKLARIFRR